MLLAMFDMLGSILPSRLANSRKIFKPNKPKGLLSFWEEKILVSFNIIGCKLQNALQDYTLH